MVLNNIIDLLTLYQDDIALGAYQFEQAAALLRVFVRASYASKPRVLPEAVHTLRLDRSSADHWKETASGFDCTVKLADADYEPPRVFVDGQQERLCILGRASFNVLSIISAINLLNHIRTKPSESLPSQRCEYPEPHISDHRL